MEIVSSILGWMCCSIASQWTKTQFASSVRICNCTRCVPATYPEGGTTCTHQAANANRVELRGPNSAFMLRTLITVSRLKTRDPAAWRSLFVRIYKSVFRRWDVMTSMLPIENVPIKCTCDCSFDLLTLETEHQLTADAPARLPLNLSVSSVCVDQAQFHLRARTLGDPLECRF